MASCPLSQAYIKPVQSDFSNVFALNPVENKSSNGHSAISRKEIYIPYKMKYWQGVNFGDF